MTTETLFLSNDFRRLYCDGVIYDSFSTFHPISFRHVLPFQSWDQVQDDRFLLQAEEAHLVDKSDDARLRVVEEYFRCGLLQEKDAINLKATVDFFDTDFFEMMGLIYANAGMFRCALRWYREVIGHIETQQPNSRSDEESVYASVGYCLYSLGLFEEAISWSKSCIGPRTMADRLCRELIDYELKPAGGEIQRTERSGSRTRYTIIAPEPSNLSETVSKLKTAMHAIVPFQDVYIDWISHEAPNAEMPPEGYPFKAEFDASCLLRHKLNLIFATCAQADVFIAKGYKPEAKRLLAEAAILEPAADIVWEKLNSLL